VGEEGDLVRCNAEAIRRCLQEHLEEDGLEEGLQERLQSLIFVHANPYVVERLKEYTEGLLYLLSKSRDHLLSADRRKDN
jgi:hypothetical protein